MSSLTVDEIRQEGFSVFEARAAVQATRPEYRRKLYIKAVIALRKEDPFAKCYDLYRIVAAWGGVGIDTVKRAINGRSYSKPKGDPKE